MLIRIICYSISNKFNYIVFYLFLKRYKNISNISIQKKNHNIFYLFKKTGELFHGTPNPENNFPERNPLNLENYFLNIESLDSENNFSILTDVEIS